MSLKGDAEFSVNRKRGEDDRHRQNYREEGIWCLDSDTLSVAMRDTSKDIKEGWRYLGLKLRREVLSC